MQQTVPLFFAGRSDGFGERLRALMNARVAAGLFGGRFGFHWGEMAANEELAHHCIVPVSATFAPEFIAAHHIDTQQLARMQTVKLVHALKSRGQATAFPAEVEAIEVAKVGLTHQGLVFPPGVDRAALFHKAWNDLHFVPALEEARRHAGSVAFSAQASAIHLRAGDIVYGRHRMSDLFHNKVCSYPIIEVLIRNQISAGFTPVLFGQDLALCRYLRDRHGVLLANDLCIGKNFDASQQAMFDISLMSRCTRVFTESSGFAIVGSLIRGGVPSNPHSGLSREQRVALIEASVFEDKSDAGVSALQTAFACRNAFVIGQIHFPTEPRFQRLLDRALEMDPENGFYHFVQAVASYASGDARTGDQIIQTILLGESQFLNTLFMKPAWKSEHEVDPYLPVLTRQAELGSAMAALFVSRAYDFRGDQVRAAQFAALFQMHASASLARQ